MDVNWTGKNSFHPPEFSVEKVFFGWTDDFLFLLLFFFLSLTHSTYRCFPLSLSSYFFLSFWPYYVSFPVSFSVYLSFFLSFFRSIINHCSLFLSIYLIMCLSQPVFLSIINSLTRLGDLLVFGQLFKACGNYYFAQIAHIFRQFL